MKVALPAPIFVVGHPRSGTTLLASMLGRHPDIASTPESLYLSQARYDMRDVFGTTPAQIAQRIMRTPMRHLAESEIALTNALTKAQSAGSKLDPRDVFATVLTAYRTTHHKPRILEKSPWHMRHIDELLAWFPDARILWIIRDGRANVASLQKVPWATHDARILSQQWVRNVALALDSESRAKSAVLRIRFEDLVRDPMGTLPGILAHIGVPPSDAVFDHSQGATTIKASETDWKQNVNQPLQDSRATAWRSELSAQDLATCARIMNPTLTRLGYQAEGDGPSALSRLRSGVTHSPAGLRIMRAGLHLLRNVKGAKQALKTVKSPA
jgi:hypothetical protein